MFDISFYGNILLQLIVLLHLIIACKKQNNTTDNLTSFNIAVLALLFIILFHTLNIVANVGSPIGLLYGPLIYAASCSLNKQNISRLHLIPYFLFSSTYLICYILHPFFVFAADIINIYYYPTYLIVTILTLISYSFITFKKRLAKKNCSPFHKPYILLDTLIFLCCAISLPLLIFVIEPHVYFHWGIKFSYLIAMLLALAGGYLLIYLLNINNTRTPSAHYDTKGADDLSLASQIRSSILTQKLYLDPEMNLQKLADITGAPVWQVSRVLNEVIGKRFYELIAEYRTMHAKELIDSDIFNRLTLEHIAQQSGFKSRSSFNRYFKSIEKCSPQEYKKRS